MQIILSVSNNFYLLLKEYLDSINLKINNSNTNIKSEILIFDKKCINSDDYDENCIFIVPLIELNIFIKLINKKIKIYALNTEQLSRNNILKDVLQHLNNNKIFDYSISNTKYITNDYYLPYQINQYEFFNYDKIYDIAMINRKQKFRRRDRIFDTIRKRCKRINKFPIMSYISTFGKERDDLLFKHKILLNIHGRDNYNVFEEIRCNRCIINKIIVITENSTYLDDYYFTPLNI